MEKITLTGVQETMLQTVFARAQESTKQDGKALAELLPDFRLKEEHSLVEGMEVIVPVYKVIGKIPAVRNLSNKIIVLEGGIS